MARLVKTRCGAALRCGVAMAGLLLLAPATAALPAGLSATAVAPAGSSIWPRLVSGMRLDGENRPEVQRFIRHYRANPEYFTAMLARAEPFLWFVLAQAEQRKLPTELVLLPAVESSWNPHAVSTSAAGGLWQFIPKTGDAYGLKDALNYDARRDPVASTTVALDLLAELHREYRDWPLALAAYNTGGVRLKQAMRLASSRQFWRLPLPPVTKDYVPRLLAIAALVRNPERYGVTLPRIAGAAAAEIVPLDQDTPLHLALQAAGVDQEVLRVFNPGLQVSGAPTHSPTLLLPPADALALRAELASLQQRPLSSERWPETRIETDPSPMSLRMSDRLSSRLSTSPTTQPADATGYQVKPGDTLFAIAQRHGLSLAQLKRMNPAASFNAIKAGQTLKLNDCSPRGCG